MDYKERQQRSSGNIKFTALLKTQTSQKFLYPKCLEASEM